MNEDLIPRSAVKEALKAVKEKGNIYCSLDPKKEKTPHAFVILKKAMDAVDAIPAVDADATDTNDKEKLVKLLDEDWAFLHNQCKEYCKNCSYYDEESCGAAVMADYPIQNGVTIATDTNVGDKWVSVDEPPTKEGWYHVAILDMKTGKYRVENDLYAIEIARMHNHEPGFCKAKSWPERDKLTHWCPYPQPPKEVHHA